MIAQAHRFHGHSALQAVYRHSKAVRTPMLTLRYTVNPRRRRYRAAVVVSKKVSKLAVERNRIRRRIYEQVRLRLHAHTNQDLVFVAYDKQLAELPADELAALLERVLRQAKLNTADGVVD